MRNWMVRAGEGGSLFEEFKLVSTIAIGWERVGDLTAVPTLEEIKAKMSAAYPQFKRGKMIAASSVVYKFRSELQEKDNVVTYNPAERKYFVGKVASEYQYVPENGDHPHVRVVVWEGECSRDDLSPATKNTLGSVLTLFEIPPAAMDDLLGNTGETVDAQDSESEEETVDAIKEDFIAKAHEFIKDKLVKLDWEDMQELVAGILRAMGYKTRVSPRGSDRGKDILASPDGLGLEDPSIRVEVKHREGQMGTQEIRSFIGGLRNNKGLYVSTGGFSKEAKYEAERSDKPVTLIDSDTLVDLITQYYDDFDADSKALIPLRKIYWPS
jgi:restriction system protein